MLLLCLIGGVKFLVIGNYKLLDDIFNLLITEAIIFLNVVLFVAAFGK